MWNSKWGLPIIRRKFSADVTIYEVTTCHTTNYISYLALCSFTVLAGMEYDSGKDRKEYLRLYYRKVYTAMYARVMISDLTFLCTLSLSQARANFLPVLHELCGFRA